MLSVNWIEVRTCEWELNLSHNNITARCSAERNLGRWTARAVVNDEIAQTSCSDVVEAKAWSEREAERFLIKMKNDVEGALQRLKSDGKVKR